MSGARVRLGWFGSSRSRIAAGILITVVIGGALYFSGKPSELERFRAELRSKGYKISFQELVGNEKVPREFFSVYKQPPKDIQEFITAGEELDKLNTNHWQFGTLRLMGGRSADSPVPLINRKNPWWGASFTTFTNQTWEDLAEVLRQAQPTLQRIRSLARAEIPERGLGGSTPVFTFINMAFWLNADAITSVRQRSRTTALEDLESLTDLAQIGWQEKHAWPQRWRIQLIGTGLRGTWEILQSAEWTEQELSRMDVAWKRVSPLQAFVACMECYLAYAGEIDSVVTREIARSNLRERVTALVGRVDRADDAMLVLQYALAYLEAVRSLQQGELWASLQPGLDEIQSIASSKSSSSYRHLGLRMTDTRMDVLFADAVRHEALRQLLLADLAIRRFKLRHNGTPPKTLRELSPDFLDVAHGRDPFSGGDLQYCTTPEGNYLLYSVGKDGVDNGGDPSVDQGQNFFWDSRDMVWPSGQ